MLQFCRRKQGRVTMFLLVFLLLISIPMIGGSLLGQLAVKRSGETFVDAVSGQTQYIPNGSIFLYGMVGILLSIVPLLLTIRCRHTDPKE